MLAFQSRSSEPGSWNIAGQVCSLLQHLWRLTGKQLRTASTTACASLVRAKPFRSPGHLSHLVPIRPPLEVELARETVESWQTKAHARGSQTALQRRLPVVCNARKSPEPHGQHRSFSGIERSLSQGGVCIATTTPHCTLDESPSIRPSDLHHRRGGGKPWRSAPAPRHPPLQLPLSRLPSGFVGTSMHMPCYCNAPTGTLQPR